MNIYVGNLSYELNETELRQAFEAYGEVQSVNIITDGFTGRSKGFGFVEMSDDSAAQNAIDGLNGKDFKGRALNVNKARPRTGDRGGDRGGGRGGDRGGRPGGGRRF